MLTNLVSNIQEEIVINTRVCGLISRITSAVINDSVDVNYIDKWSSLCHIIRGKLLTIGKQYYSVLPYLSRHPRLNLTVLLLCNKTESLYDQQ